VKFWKNLKFCTVSIKIEYFEFLAIFTEEENAFHNDDKKEVINMWFETKISTK